MRSSVTKYSTFIALFNPISMNPIGNFVFRTDTWSLCYKLTCYHLFDEKKKVFILSLRFVPSVQSTFLHFIPSLYFAPGAQFAVCSLQSAVCSLQSAVCSLQSAVCSLQSAVCSLQSVFCFDRFCKLK